jgi:hypothetical protein
MAKCIAPRSPRRPSPAGLTSPRFLSGRLCLVLLVALTVPFPLVAGADGGSSHGGKLPICVAFDPIKKRFGPVGATDPGQTEDCPPGYAFMALDTIPGRPWQSPGGRPVQGYCCPLPAGALVGAPFDGANECVDQSVATGGGARENGAPGDAFFLRCTHINTERYRLGERTSGWSVGWMEEFISAVPLRAMGIVHRTTRSRLPVTLRYGFFRRDWRSWEFVGCAGHPWGSLLVSRKGKGCHELEFRQLLVVSEDGQATKPAKVYSGCTAMSSPFEEVPDCLRDE